MAKPAQGYVRHWRLEDGKAWQLRHRTPAGVAGLFYFILFGLPAGASSRRAAPLHAHTPGEGRCRRQTVRPLNRWIASMPSSAAGRGGRWAAAAAAAAAAAKRRSLLLSQAPAPLPPRHPPKCATTTFGGSAPPRLPLVAPLTTAPTTRPTALPWAGGPPLPRALALPCMLGCTPPVVTSRWVVQTASLCLPVTRLSALHAAARQRIRLTPPACRAHLHAAAHGAAVLVGPRRARRPACLGLEGPHLGELLLLGACEGGEDSNSRARLEGSRASGHNDSRGTSLLVPLMGQCTVAGRWFCTLAPPSCRRSLRQKGAPARAATAPSPLCQPRLAARLTRPLLVLGEVHGHQGGVDGGVPAAAAGGATPSAGGVQEAGTSRLAEQACAGRCGRRVQHVQSHGAGLPAKTAGQHTACLWGSAASTDAR